MKAASLLLAVCLSCMVQVHAQEFASVSKHHVNRTKTQTTMSEEYLDNHAYLVLANQKYATFDEAKKNAVTQVKDGDPLWLHARFPGPIGNYVAVARESKSDGSVTKRALMKLEIGPVNSEQAYYSTLLCFQGCRPDELVYAPIDEAVLKVNEFSICLTSFVKNQNTRIFLEAVGGGSPGIWENEIRLSVGQPNAGMPSFIDFFPPAAIAPIVCNVEDGNVKYKKMYNDLKDRLEKGDASDNELPSKGKFDSPAIKAKVIAEAKEQGWTVKQCYFENNNWMEIGEADEIGRYRRVHAIVTYKKGSDCFFSIIEVKENYSFSAAKYGPASYEIIVRDTPIDCAKY